MKNATLNFALTLAIICCIANTLSAQRIVEWKGGMPGQETNWNCARNWSTGQVPDIFSDVIIPDVSTTTFAAPVIKSGSFEVNSIELLSNAQLTIGVGAELSVTLSDNGFGNPKGLNVKGMLLTKDSSGINIAKK